MPCRAALALALAAAPLAGAQAKPAEPAAESVPLRLANRTVFQFRATALGFSPHDRAAAAAGRLRAALHPGATGNVTTRGTAEGTAVEVDAALIFVVTAADVNALAGESAETAAAAAADVLRRAIAEERVQTRPRYLLLATGSAALGSLVYLALLRGLLLLDRWARRRFARAVAARAHRVELAGVRLLDARRFFAAAQQSFLALLAVLGLALSYLWLTFVLERFPYTRPWGERLEGALLELLLVAGNAVLASLPGLFVVALIVLVARFVTETMGAFFDRVRGGQLALGWLDAETARPTRRLATALTWLFALVMAYPYLPGSQTDAFKGLSVLLGVMVTIGGSSAVGQLTSGLILVYTRALRTGEYVRIGPDEGTVIELGAFATRIRTGLGEELMLPNTVVLATTTRNYSRAVAGAGCIVDTTVTIGYSTPWRQVHAMLEQAARRTSGIAAEPAPFVRQTALSDFYVEYRLVAYTPAEQPAERPAVLDRLHANIQDVFNEHGVQIMSPHYMTDPARPHVVPKADFHLAPAKPPSTSGEG